MANLREHGSGVQVVNRWAARELRFLNGLNGVLSPLGLTRAK
jgi:hypothetical protein